MFRFASPQYLYLLFVIPILLGIYLLYIYTHKRRITKFGEWKLMLHLTPSLSYSRKHWKFGLLLTSLFLLIITLARPQYGTTNGSEQKNGIEVVIAFDVSNSMYCQDVSPSRFQKAKMTMDKMIDNFENDKVGIVAFAGNARTILPSTNNIESAKACLNELSPEMDINQGTSLSAGINYGLSCFTSDDSMGKALIIVTDAEDHEHGALSAAQNAHKEGVNIFVMLVGTPEGGQIIMPDGTPLLDYRGNVVTTRLNEEIGKSIAEAGKGKYINIDNSLEAENILNTELSNLKHSTYISKSFSEHGEQFVMICIIILVLIMIEACVTERKKSFFKHFILRK